METVKQRWAALVLVGLVVMGWLLSACNTGQPIPTAPAIAEDPSPTLLVSYTPSITPTPSLSPTTSNTPTVGPSATITPTASASATLPFNPTPDRSTQSPFATPATAIPTAVTPIRFTGEVVNVLLLGRDTEMSSGSYRTDVIIIASINRSTNTVTLLSIPRDLYVYIPGWTMNRINTAANYGDRTSYPGGGVGLLAQTILYNLGIPIHYHAMIDFDGFVSAVDVFGGVNIPVTCAMRDWRLKSPELDVNNPANWEQYYLDVGVQTMDGNMALWYSRSRRATNDFDRSRRQQRVLRAVLAKALSTDSLSRVPALYNQYVQFVRTDVTVADAMTFVPIAANLQNFDIKSRFIGPGQVNGWTTPEGASVLLPNPERLQALLAEAFLPPRSAALREALPKVEVINATGLADRDRLAADNLAWEGFAPVLGPDQSRLSITTIYDYTTSDKGSYLRELQALFNVRDVNVVKEPNAEAPYPYRVVLGDDFNSCTYGIGFAAPAPTPAPGDTTDPAPAGDLQAVALKLREPLVIDGDLNDWQRSDFAYVMDKPAFGREAWGGLSDASASWATAWDETYLYFAVIVRDDVFSQPAQGANLLQGDSIELLLNMDIFGDINITELNNDDYQLGFSPGDLVNPPAPHEAYLWYPLDRQGPQNNIILSFRLTPEGYQGEIAIPWAILHHAPAEGQAFGFVLSLIDNDTPGQPGVQSIISTSDQREIERPNSWDGRLYLGGPRP